MLGTKPEIKVRPIGERCGRGWWEGVGTGLYLGSNPQRFDPGFSVLKHF